MAGGLLPHLGQACRDAREQRGVRQIDVATRAGTTHVTVSNFETGRRWPINPDGIVNAYAHELEIDAAELWLAAAIALQNRRGPA